MKTIKVLFVFLILTIITQFGGLLYVVNRYTAIKFIRFKKYKWFKRQASFITVYALVSIFLIPPLALLNNRKPLPVLSSKVIQPQNWFTVAANRHYVTTDLCDLINDVAVNYNNQSKNKGLKLNYLDANFPFIDGFPLIPHLSHNDGKKLDLAFRYYKKNDLVSRNKTMSLFGYGVYVEPTSGEVNQTTICKERSWFYDVTKYIGIPTNSWLSFDESETKRLMQLLISSEVSKIFIEPNLKSRLKLNSDKIRFHGCHAVRHDDHIHVQIH